jgi:branched-chain amino acid transport system permease protein
MAALLQHLLDALSVGSTYALLALGLTLVFGVMNLINFAYGMILVAAGYGMAVVTAAGISLNAALIVGVLSAIGISVLMGYAAYRPFLSAPPVTLLITSFGVELALQAIAILVFGNAPRIVPTPPFLAHVWTINGVRLSATELASLALVVLVIGGIYLVMHHTTLGLQMRAAAEDRAIARVLAVRPEQVVVLVFALSGLVVGLVSILWFAKLGTVTPLSDLNPTIKAFIALVLGGLGSISGAVVGGLVLGGLETLFAVTLPGSVLPYQDVFVFTLVIILLLWRPNGLLGSRTAVLSR